MLAQKGVYTRGAWLTDPEVDTKLVMLTKRSMISSVRADSRGDGARHRQVWLVVDDFLEPCCGRREGHDTPAPGIAAPKEETFRTPCLGCHCCCVVEKKV